MPDNRLVGALKELDPHLFSRLRRDVSEDRVYSYLQPLADTLAPSQTARYTRACVLEQLLGDEGVLSRANVRCERNYQSTGNFVLLLGQQPRRKQVWLLAHLDIISYFIEPPVGGSYPLMPFSYHMMHPGRRAAVAVDYDLEQRRLKVAGRGDIVTDNEGQVFFQPDDQVSLYPGQRVCFFSKMTWTRESGELRGSLDDAGAAAALTLATVILADYDVELMLGLTDEEEGVAAAGNQTIARGGARLLRHFCQPELAIVSDIHEAIPMAEGHGSLTLRPGDGACFAERTSRGRGAATPPPLYMLQRKLAAELHAKGIRWRENWGGYIGRSEDLNATLRTPNVSLVGFLGKNRHFERDVTSANIRDLVDLTRVVVCYVLLTQTPIWLEMMG